MIHTTKHRKRRERTRPEHHLEPFQIQILMKSKHQ